MEKAWYLRKAAEFAALATEAKSDSNRQVWLQMAKTYMRLARSPAFAEDRRHGDTPRDGQKG